MSDHDNRHEKAVSEKPAKQLGPRQRRQALLSLGPCCRTGFANWGRPGWPNALLEVATPPQRQLLEGPYVHKRQPV